jgi:type IV pilus secretin PilQ/predicted competence protein
VNRKRLLLIAGMAALLACALHVPDAVSLTPGRLVSLDADDANLPAVLKILAEKGELNIITGPGVAAGRITIHMKDVPIDQAVNLVVRAAGLAYERIGNSILVADGKSLKEETGLSSYIVNLKFADANDVKAALHGLTDQIEVDRGGNRLIVVTSPRVISEIEEIVAEMDKPARQVMLEARIIEVSTNDAKTYGVDWDLLNRQGMVFVEGNYTDVSGTFTDPTKVPNLQMVGNAPGSRDVFKLRNFSRLPMSFAAFIDLMIKDGNAKVLASPKLATLNGKPATMLAGERIPFVISQTVFAGSAAAPTTSIQKEEVGIKLAITPLINADGFITTTIEPEVSSVVSFNSNGLPVISTRQASTTVRMRDSSSVIIGGLLNTEQTTNRTKLPILGELPGLGQLFTHTTTSSRKTDLVIEVTPHILPEQQ